MNKRTANSNTISVQLKSDQAKLYHELHSGLGISSSDYLKSIVTPVLDSYKKQKEAAVQAVIDGFSDQNSFFEIPSGGDN